MMNTVETSTGSAKCDGRDKTVVAFEPEMDAPETEGAADNEESKQKKKLT